MMRRILFYHLGALGDFITCLPVAQSLRSAWPDAELILLGRPRLGALGTASRHFDKVWDATSLRFAPLFSAESPDPGLLATLSRMDMAVVFTSHDASLLRNLARCAIPLIRHHPPFPDTPMPVIDYHLQLVADLPSIDRLPVIRTGRSDRACALFATYDRLAVIHPGSGSRMKNWPIDRYRTLSSVLSGKGLHVVWLAGDAESDLAFGPDEDVLRSWDLIDLASLLAGCVLYVGNDSGVSHLAAATGCATTVLFGPSNPVVWAPAGPRVRIVAAGQHAGPSFSPARIETITLEQVIETIGMFFQ